MDPYYEKIRNDIIILHISGSMNIDMSQKIEAVLEHILEAHSDSHIFVNMFEVTFLGSSTLMALVNASKKQKDKKLKLVIVKPNDICRQVTELTNFTRLIPLFDTEEEAIKGLDNK